MQPRHTVNKERKGRKKREAGKGEKKEEEDIMSGCRLDLLLFFKKSEKETVEKLTVPVFSVRLQLLKAAEPLSAT
jgi:hypothetical protein